MPRLISATHHEPNSQPAPISSQGRSSGDSSDLFVAIRGYAEGDCIGGKYTLIDRLGEGGMGAVWRAHNELLDVDVALKLIRTDEVEAAEGTLMSDRLLQEARAAARLGHPSIARVFDYGTTERSHPYIVMELLRGEDLAEALSRRGRVSNTKAVATLMPIAHALAAAHSQGIVHRDLKPENVFLARLEDGRVVPKLVDFGIAKMGTNKGNRLTQTGTMLGSPIYMSPEQARGDEVDHRADVWAFCVVLYELVTGRPPFEGRNYNALLYAIIADEPRPLPIKAEGDEELWNILRKGFEKERDRRWSTIDELGRALAQWLIVRGVQEDITGASLVAQWLRVMPSGDVLTSMLPAPVNFQMPVIPRRSDRAKWEAATRSLGPRSSRSGNSFQAPESTGKSRAHSTPSFAQWRELARTRFLQVVADLVPLLRDPALATQRRWVMIGAGCSVVAGALGVALALPGQTPPLAPTETAPVVGEFVVRVMPDIEPVDAIGVADATRPVVEVADKHEPEEQTGRVQPETTPVGNSAARVNPAALRRTVVAPRKTPPTRLKNPFD